MFNESYEINVCEHVLDAIEQGFMFISRGHSSGYDVVMRSNSPSLEFGEREKAIHYCPRCGKPISIKAKTSN